MRDDGVNFPGAAIGEEDGAGVSAECADELRAVVLLVLPRALVLLDDVVCERVGDALVDVVVHMADGGEAGLDVCAHALLVEVKGGRGFAAERAVLLEALEVRLGERIDGVGVGVRVGGEFEFGAIHAEECVRLAFGEDAGLVGI